MVHGCIQVVGVVLQFFALGMFGLGASLLINVATVPDTSGSLDFMTGRAIVGQGFILMAIFQQLLVVMIFLYESVRQILWETKEEVSVIRQLFGHLPQLLHNVLQPWSNR